MRLSKQYGLPYLPFMVMENFQFLEKQAEKQGLTLKVSWTTLSNASAMMEAILSGQMDFITPGVPTLATMWDKTVGTPNEIRALSAVQSMPYVLVTREPRIKSLRDFTDKDRIALPAVKLTGHAIALQMAVAKEFGREQYDKLDLDHGLAVAPGRGRRAARRQGRDQRAFRELAVLLHRAGDARHPPRAAFL